MNQGGQLIEDLIRHTDPHIPYRGVNAKTAKRARAEPVATLYERGRVHHAGLFRELEDQLCTWTPRERKSPDRLDALVWAVSTLIRMNQPNPGVRRLDRD